MKIPNPFGAATKLRAETEKLEESERNLSAASTMLREKERTFEATLKVKEETSVNLGLARAEAERIVEQQATRIEGLEQELAEAPFKAMEELVGLKGIRIGYRDFDLINIQSMARSVEPSIRIERENFRWVFYADKVLEQAQMRRLESKIGFGLERG